MANEAPSYEADRLICLTGTTSEQNMKLCLSDSNKSKRSKSKATFKLSSACKISISKVNFTLNFSLFTTNVFLFFFDV